MISVWFTGGSWGGKLTQSSWLDISDALWDIKFDREIISVPDISSINGESEIEGDAFTYGERYSLILWRYEDALSLRLRDIIKERSIHFLIESEVQGNIPSGNIIIATQRQFTQLMNLALSIQNYWKIDK